MTAETTPKRKKVSDDLHLHQQKMHQFHSGKHLGRGCYCSSCQRKVRNFLDVLPIHGSGRNTEKQDYCNVGRKAQAEQGLSGQDDGSYGPNPSQESQQLMMTEEREHDLSPSLGLGHCRKLIFGCYYCCHRDEVFDQLKKLQKVRFQALVRKGTACPCRLESMNQVPRYCRVLGCSQI